MNLKLCIGFVLLGIVLLNGISGQESLPGLDERQSRYARIISTVAKSEGVGVVGCQVAIVAGMAESSLKIMANNAVPASLKYPHDTIGHDHDNTGIYQLRASVYKDIARNMDPAGATGIIFKELKAIPGWEKVSPDVAAQKILRAATPSSYTKYMSLASEVCNILIK